MDPDLRRRAFGTALRNVRSDARVSQQELATLIEATQSRISAYERGEYAPPVEVAAQIEEALRLAPGMLTVHLGYLPLGAIDAAHDRPCTVIDAVLVDDQLTDDGRQALLATYRALTRGR